MQGTNQSLPSHATCSIRQVPYTLVYWNSENESSIFTYAVIRPSCWSRHCYSRSSSALAAARQLLENELESIRQAGTFKHERVITSKQAVSVQVQGQLKPLLNFCANNYLGLSVSLLVYFLSICWTFSLFIEQCWRHQGRSKLWDVVKLS